MLLAQDSHVDLSEICLERTLDGHLAAVGTGRRRFHAPHGQPLGVRRVDLAMEPNDSNEAYIRVEWARY